MREGELVDYVAVAALKRTRAARGVRGLQVRCRDRRAGRLSKRSAPSAARCCRASPASRRCATSMASRGGNGRRNGGSRTTTNVPPCATGADARRDRLRRIRAMDRRPAIARLPRSGAAARHAASGSISTSPSACRADGFDAWNEQVAISRHLAVGAPPDPLNRRDRTGALPASTPPGSRQQSFAPYRDMLRASMRYAGAIRLDHVLGLKRLYLVPHGFRRTTASMCRCRSRRCWPSQRWKASPIAASSSARISAPCRKDFASSSADGACGPICVMMFERDYHSGAFRGIGSLPGQCAGDVQHPRSRDLRRLALASTISR